MVMFYCFVNVPKIPIIKMKDKKDLLVQYKTFMLICIVLKLVAVISLSTTFFTKKVSVSRRLALSDIQQILLIDIKACAVLSYFLIKKAELRFVVDFVDTMDVCTHSVGI